MHCAYKYLIFLFFILFLWSSMGANAQAIGQLCKNNEGICQSLKDCIHIADNNEDVEYCEGTSQDDNRVVCCPQRWQTIAEMPNKPRRISERKCCEYSQQIYSEQRCDPKPLIIAGTKAQPREFPHMALLGVKKVDKNITKFNWYCGGTLISPNYVLTAAHCFDTDNEIFIPPNIIRLGELNYNDITDDARPEDFAIANIITHPNYNSLMKYNDIALVKLSGEVSFSLYIAPACLLDSGNSSDLSHFIAAGWGATKDNMQGKSEHLLKVSLDHFNEIECSESVRKAEDFPRGYEASSQICAGSRKSSLNSPDTCYGDSGGPLFNDHRDYSCMYTIFGITSFGVSQCGIGRTVAIYTRVYQYIEWIESIVWNNTNFKYSKLCI